jgi:hypothetical protein
MAATVAEMATPRFVLNKRLILPTPFSHGRVGTGHAKMVFPGVGFAADSPLRQDDQIWRKADRCPTPTAIPVPLLVTTSAVTMQGLSDF